MRGALHRASHPCCGAGAGVAWGGLTVPLAVAVPAPVSQPSHIKRQLLGPRCAPLSLSSGLSGRAACGASTVDPTSGEY